VAERLLPVFHSQGPRFSAFTTPKDVHFYIYRVAQNKIPHQTICDIFATNGQILEILEAF